MNLSIDSKPTACGIFDVWCGVAGFEYLGYLLIAISLFGIWRLIYIHIVQKAQRPIGAQRLPVEMPGDEAHPDQEQIPEAPRRIRPVYVDVDQVRKSSSRPTHTALVPQAVVEKGALAQRVALAPRMTENERRPSATSDEYQLRREVAYFLALFPLGILIILGMMDGWWFPGLTESRGLTVAGLGLVGVLFLCNLPVIIRRARITWMTDKVGAVGTAGLHAVAVLIPATLFVMSIGMTFAPGSLISAGAKPAADPESVGEWWVGLTDTRTEEITRTPIVPTSVTYMGGSVGGFFGGAEASKISGLAQPAEGSPYPFSTTRYETGSDWELVLEQTCVTATSGSWLLEFPTREKTHCWTNETAIIGSSVFDK